MEDNSFPNITSFIIRFIQEHAIDNPERIKYRGSIRHIQSDKEISFTRWKEAMQFMEKYVSIEEMSNSLKASPPIEQPKDTDITL